MLFQRWFSRANQQHRLAQLAVEMTAILGPVVQRVAVVRARGMERAEARGYIRAKAGPAVARHLSMVSWQLADLTTDQTAKLASEVVERLVQLVLEDTLWSKVLRSRRAA